MVRKINGIFVVSKTFGCNCILSEVYTDAKFVSRINTTSKFHFKRIQSNGRCNTFAPSIFAKMKQD